MFRQIFVEKEVEKSPYTQNILSRLRAPVTTIDRYDQIWGQKKKPYLHKRDSLDLFIAKKRGNLVKEAPQAYGGQAGKHFYFIHAYNCIYECEYCYLQTHFQTPDLVLFVNHEEIINEMQEIVDAHQGDIWFHAGEFSDSLALSHLTHELPAYFDFFKKNPRAKLEIRTKSVNIKPLMALDPRKNIFISFSVGSEYATQAYDHKTPSLTTRLRAIQKLRQKGFQIGLHFDPLVYTENFKEESKLTIKKVKETIALDEVSYLSVGVIRSTDNLFNQMKKNYPESSINHGQFVKTESNMFRYPRPMRMWMMNTFKEALIQNGCPKEVIYFCMEN